METILTVPNEEIINKYLKCTEDIFKNRYASLTVIEKEVLDKAVYSGKLEKVKIGQELVSLIKAYANLQNLQINKAYKLLKSK